MASFASDIAHSHEKVSGPFIFKHPWIKIVEGSNNAALFVEIINTEKTPDSLIGAQSSNFQKLALHSMEEEGGIYRMRSLEEMIIPANEKVLLAPGGDHVMLIGLKYPLLDGEFIPITLLFKRFGKVELNALVESVNYNDKSNVKHSSEHKNMHNKQ